MIYIKDMDMPVDCLACRISCKHESYMVTGRPEDCPLEEAKTGDLISRSDAVELLTEIVFDEPPYFDSETLCRLYAEEQINTLPSAEIAETEPIVIRSKTLLPTKDFMEWAKRIKEVNPNAVVIPCDAEVVSAEAVPTQAEKCEDCIHNGTNKDKITCKECASAEAVQGEWITIDTEVTSVPVYWNEEQRQSDERGAGILEECECSACGWKTNFRGHKKLGVNKSFNFCPNCGARMTPYKGGDSE